jgi:peptidoglycan/xylan/chitin deacetylase (PgdA/CDA1 family)
VLALSHMLILYPTLRPNQQWLGPVVTHFETDAKEVWLTIDDGPTADTAAVLDLFERLSVKATFFVKGTLAEAHPELVQTMIARGHSVANHSHTHPSGTFWCLLAGRIAHEVDRCNAALDRSAPQRERWFRAPVGMKNPFVHPILRRRNMRLIGWTVRGFDAVLSDAAAIAERILPELRPGAIVVLHQGREHSLAVLEHVIGAIHARGYTFVVPSDGQLRAGVSAGA